GLAVRLPDIFHAEHGEHHAFGIAQGNLAAARGQFLGEFLGHVERDRHRPQRAVPEPHVVADALVIGTVHESAERREAAAHQQFQITKLPGCQIPRRPILRVRFQFRGARGWHLQLNKFSTVWGNKMTGHCIQSSIPPVRVLQTCTLSRNGEGPNSRSSFHWPAEVAGRRSSGGTIAHDIHVQSMLAGKSSNSASLGGSIWHVNHWNKESYKRELLPGSSFCI